MNAVSRIAFHFGVRLGYSGRELHALIQACRFHDVGKAALPSEILQKRSTLTTEEFEVIKQHTTIGAKMLSSGNHAFSQIAAIGALTHHERYDGSGYPYQMAGDEIPMVGKIIALCDVYEALLSKRPYKEAWSKGAALEYIAGQRGKHFDPHLAEVFLQLAEFGGFDQDSS